MSSLFDSVDDSEDIFSSSKSTSSPPPPLSSETDVSVTAGGDDVRESVNGTCNDDEKMAKEGESNEELGNAVKDEGINEEGHGGNKDKKDESNEHPGDPLTSALMSNEGSNEGSEEKKFESSPENEEIFKESDDKESPVSDPLLNQPTTKHNDLFSEDTVDTSLFGSATSSSRSTNMFPYATGDDDLFKETTTRQEKQEMNKKDEDKDREEIEGEVNESGKEETPQHDDDDETVKVKNTVAVEDEFVVVTSDEVPPQEEVEHAMQQREIARKKSQEENDKLVSEEKTKVYSDGLSYDERAALRKHKREQRKLQTTTGTKTTEKSSKSATTYRSDLKTKPQKLPTKPSPKPSPNIGRRAASTTSLKIEQARTDSHSTGTDPQEQIHQLTSKLHKAQSELTREKKKLESLLAEERSKVKQLERTIASKDAEIADLKRKAKEHQKQSSSITRPKKGDSPGITRKISDSSPRSLKRVGSGEKGTPTGSPAELRKQRAGVTRETTSSVADTRKKFIKTTTTSSEIKRKTRLSSKSEEGEETKVSKDKPPPGPKKETTPVPTKPSKPAPPVKSDRIKSPVPAKTEKPTPTEEDKSTTNTTNSSAQLFRTTPSPIHIQQTSKGKAPTLTSDPLSTPPVGEDRVKSPITTDSPTTIVEASKDESSVSATTNMTSVIAESPPENGVTDDQEDTSIPRALQLISTFERKSSQHAQQNTQSWIKRKKTGNDEEVSALSPDKESRSVSPQQEIHPAGSPQLAPGPQKDTEKENDVKKTTVEVAVTEVPLREKILKKSVSNTSTTGENKPGLSLFDNRTKRSSWMSQQKEECEVCKTTVYAMERLEADKLVYHKTCFKCSVCSKTLGVGTYAALQGVIYCKVHFKQLFKMKGNYDEGFGREQHKTKWSKKETQ